MLNPSVLASNTKKVFLFLRNFLRAFGLIYWNISVVVVHCFGYEISTHITVISSLGIWFRTNASRKLTVVRVNVGSTTYWFCVRKP